MVSIPRLWLAAPLLAAGMLALAGSPSAAAVKCVQVQNIRQATSDDGKVLRLQLRDGTILDNRMNGTCRGLRFGGFSWVVHNGQICENTQSLRVLQSGEICTLGRFDPPRKPPQKRG